MIRDKYAGLLSLDRSDMLGKIAGLSGQLKAGVSLLKGVRLQAFKPENIVIAGLGGSAICGDLLKAIYEKELKIPVEVSRNYGLPAWAGKKTLCFVISYSGNTEETVSAFLEAKKKRAHIIAVATGGKIAELAEKSKIPLIKIPCGFLPRAALGYMFISADMALKKMNLLKHDAVAEKETINIMGKLSKECSPSRPLALNPAKRLAGLLKGRIPIVYGASGITDSVARRWKGQISENAKVLSFFNSFPELNHNELVGWSGNRGFAKHTAVVFLSDKACGGRIKLQMQVAEDLIKRKTEVVIKLEGKGDSLMARMFYLIMLGDFASAYLGLLNNTDPSPIEAINALKKRLKSAR